MPLLPRSDIPNELWKDSTIRFPEILNVSYENLIEELCLRERCLDCTLRRGIVGGESREATLEHFALRYGVSSCRVIGLVIDPENAFIEIPDDLLTTFSEGRVSLLDVGCGTGAAGSAFLSCIAALRMHGAIPKEPLDVRILGGDCSETALDIYSKMMEQMRPALARVGIEFTLIPISWQAEACDTTSKMCDCLFEEKPVPDEYIVVLADFISALKTKSTMDDSIRHIFDRMSNKRGTIVCIEPGDYNDAKDGMKKLLKMLHPPWQHTKQNEILSHNYEWYHPIQHKIWPCRIMVKQFKKQMDI